MTGLHISQLGVHPFTGQDIRSLFEHQAVVRRDHPFLIWCPFTGDDHIWTYGEFRRALMSFAAGLHRRGVRPGDRVMIHVDNSAEGVIAWLGTAWAGAVAVMTNTRSSADEVAYFASHSRSVAVITQPKFAGVVRETCGNARWIAVTSTNSGEPADMALPEWAVPFEEIAGDPATLPPRPHDPLAPFGIQYTSGTTARPKAVLWTHANALWGARINSDHQDLRPDDVHWAAMPLFHTNAQAYSLLAAAWVGASCVLQPKFSSSRFWAVSLKHGCTWASMAPFCLKALLDQPVPKHNYRLWGYAVCDPPTDAYFKVKTIGWWGMTETLTHGIVGSVHQANTSLSIGRVAPEYRLKVLTEDGRDAQPGETGDLRIFGVRGLSLFEDYVDNRKATEDAFDADGFLITGDRVRIAEDGSIFFSDRSKDMLKVGGENVAASEIERVIMEVPGVSEVAVVARRHPMLDEVPVAFVIPAEPSSAMLRDEILAACKQKLADFKMPREVRLVPSLPRSTLEKIAKAQLRAILDAETAPS
jgi:crotonobetaine/carnitine-CoA ligase